LNFEKKSKKSIHIQKQSDYKESKEKNINKVKVKKKQKRDSSLLGKKGRHRHRLLKIAGLFSPSIN